MTVGIFGTCTNEMYLVDTPSRPLSCRMPIQNRASLSISVALVISLVNILNNGPFLWTVTKYKALMLVVLVIISLYVLRCFQYKFLSSVKWQITSSESDEYSAFPAVSRNYISHPKLHYILFHILGCFQQWQSDILDLQFCRRWLWQMFWRFLSSFHRLLRPRQ